MAGGGLPRDDSRTAAGPLRAPSSRFPARGGGGSRRVTGTEMGQKPREQNATNVVERDENCRDFKGGAIRRLVRDEGVAGFRDSAGSAAVRAARWRKFRRGSFMLNLPSHHSITSSEHDEVASPHGSSLVEETTLPHRSQDAWRIYHQKTLDRCASTATPMPEFCRRDHIGFS